ncbi:DinB family protein, partial [Klebsiella aerogenes]|uniref:DinB family protein n=1 Tax=Klebsiella aerogenes TaxID=548 RepID=UPI001952EA95
LYYLDMVEEGGVGLAVFDAWTDFEDPTKLAAVQAEADRRLIVFCNELNKSGLERRVPTDRGDDGIIPERIGDLLAHLLLHQIHHRGQ